MITEEILQVPVKEFPLTGVSTWRNSRNGFKVVDLEFKADPKKRSEEWIAQSKSGMPTAEWEREYGSQWVVYDGKPVYGDFDETAHVLRGSIISPRRARLVSGWDAGPNDVNLAWCLGLVIPSELAVIFIDEYQVDDGDIKDFVEVVGARLRLEWNKLGGFSIHIADQSVFTKSGVADGKCMADIMRQHNMAPMAGEISFAQRRIAVNDLLMHTFKSVEGRLIPKWRAHERCELLIEAMRGGYVYGRANLGIGGQYKPTPIKNKFSHIANAMEYVCSRLETATTEIPYEGRSLPRRSLV